MKKLTGKCIVLLIIAALICIPSVVLLIIDINLWVASIFGFVAAVILVIVAFAKNKKTYTTELTFVGTDPRAPENAIWAYCELKGNQFKLVIPNHVYKPHKLVIGARYKVDYTAISADSDPKTSGIAIKMNKI